MAADIPTQRPTTSAFRPKAVALDLISRGFQLWSHPVEPHLSHPAQGTRRIFLC